LEKSTSSTRSGVPGKRAVLHAGRRLLVGAALALVPCVAADAQDGKGGAPRAAGQVVVQNRLEREVSLWVNGRTEGRCAAGEVCRLPGVPAGALRLKAATDAQGPVASESLVLDAGETFTWTLYPLLEWGEEKGTGTVVLVNRLRDPVTVLIGGNPAGTLRPEGTRAYPRVVAGEVEIRVQDPEGREVAARTVELRAGTLERWEIGAPARAAPAGRRAPAPDRRTPAAR
jgi:hypothetical protein